MRISSSSGTYSFANVLVAGNEGDQCSTAGGVFGGATNLASDATCGENFTQVDDPLLGALGDYGGDTQTVPLLPGSPAIDAGDGATCLATDQRGIGRVGTCDIGAFESRGFTLALASGNNQHQVPGLDFATPLAVTVTNGYSEPVDGGQLLYTGPVGDAGTDPTIYTATVSGGVVTQTVTANLALGGPYTVTARTRGAAPAIDFSLTNSCGDAITVTNNTDSSVGSLRWAVAYVCDGGIITFDAALENQTIVLTSGQIEIEKTVTIDGPGAAKLAVSGNNDSRVFDISASGVVTLTAITVRDGNAVDVGGGIRNSGRLTLSAAAIVSNTASTYGGGIGSSGAGAVVTITASTIATNTAAYGGGGISTDNGSVVTVSGSTLTGNSISTAESVTSGGGAIFGAFGSSVTVNESNLTFNSASGAYGGGAIYSAGPLTITGSSFISNTAALYGESEGQGGAVSFTGNNLYTVAISGTSFLSNTAYNRGGALYVASGTLDLDGGTLAGNTAAGSGELGGALYCDSCLFTIDGTTFTNNEAVRGGAFYISDKNADFYSTITSSTFQGNRAAPDGDGEGGAIYIDVYEGLTITGTAVLSNAASAGGGLYINSIGLDEGSLSLSNSQVAGNTAVVSGGGLFNSQGWVRIMDGATFTANAANSGGALYNDAWLRVRDAGFSANTARFGGALYNATSERSATVDTSIFGGNRSDCDGGAIYVAGQIDLTASELYGNQASVNCKDGSQNTIQSIGGAIYVAGQLMVNGSTFHDNAAFGGGALGISGSESYSSTVQVTGSAIYSNSAQFAGAVAIAGPSTTRIEQSSIYSNTAMAAGGIGSGYGGATLDIVNTTLAGNRANSLASALFVADSDVMNQEESYGPDTLLLRNVTIAGNRQNGDNSDPFFAFVGLDNGFGGPTLGITNTIIAAGSEGEAGLSLRHRSIPQIAPTHVTNLDNDGTCGSNFKQSDTILLGPLGEYGAVFRDNAVGGATPVTPTLVAFPLLPGSAAIDAGAGSQIKALGAPAGDCPFSDQRGVRRPVGSACDIGAFESQGFTLAKMGGDEQSTPWGSVFAAPLAVTVSSSHDEPVNGGVVTFAGPLSGVGAVPITQTATVASGAISVTVAANSAAGAYSVTVAASGAQPVAFSLANVKHATQTSVQSSLNPAPYSRPVTITASVAASGMTAAAQATAPTGQVRFSDATGELATVNVVNGVAAFSRDTWAVGTHTITVEYLGDTLFAGSSSSPLAQVVGKHGTATSLATRPTRRRPARPWS